MSLRFKLYSLLSLPIVALLALWAFVSGHVVGDFFELRTTTTVFEFVGSPSTALATELQRERKEAALFLSARQPDATRLLAARGRTDRAAEGFNVGVTAREAGAVITPEMREGIDRVTSDLATLTSVRQQVDARSMSRLDAVQSYGNVTDSVYRLYDQLVTVPEIRLYQQAVGLQRVAHSRDLMSREDALISGATLAGQLTHDEYEAIEVLAPNRRLLLTEGMATLDTELRDPYSLLVDSADHRRLNELEHDIIEDSVLPLDREAWSRAADRVGTSMDQLLVSRSQLLNARADAAAGGIIATIVAAGGMGMISIMIAVIWSVRLGRGLTRELAALHRAAGDMAQVRLPDVVERLRKGTQVDVETEAPPIVVEGATLEVRDLAQAFSSVQHTAVAAAVGQAELRKGLNRVFRNLARRNQSLVHRQLSHLDIMQRKADDPETLADLFRLDHLTTRMRRQAEGLVILSGAPAGRAWRNPVPLVDVVRGAVAEVEGYTRVNVLPMPEAALEGSAAADVIHLLAELVENATIYSPPNTFVSVFGELVGRGFVVEVEDRGLGLPDAEREELNARLADPPEFDLIDSDRLGLFVVGRLAVRHGIKVTLRRSAYAGLTAIVLIPLSLITEPVGDIAHTGPD